MRVLVSQKEPAKMTAWEPLKQDFGAELEFRPLFSIEPLTSREFREQRINLAEYTAIVFSSRHAIDAYFKLCEELRIKVPETQKYFCTTELVATYLQKHIVYRKRKIFFGNGTPQSVVSLIGPKHKGEKFLITKSDSSNTKTLSSLFKAAGLDFSEAVLVKSVTEDFQGVDLSAYDILVLYNPADVKSLQQNFPDLKPEDLHVISYGHSIVKALEEAGITPVVKAPLPEASSAAKAVELYLNGR